MEKAKRKEQPYNVRHYWIIFSVLTVLLLIPFRIVGYWGLTYIIYAVISLLMLGALVRFIRRYSWRKWIVGLMLICVLLPIGQIVTIDVFCSYVSTENNIERFSCGTCNPITILAVSGTPIGIQTEVDFSTPPFLYDGLFACPYFNGVKWR